MHSSSQPCRFFARRTTLSPGLTGHQTCTWTQSLHHPTIQPHSPRSVGPSSAIARMAQRFFPQLAIASLPELPLTETPAPLEVARPPLSFFLSFVVFFFSHELSLQRIVVDTSLPISVATAVEWMSVSGHCFTAHYAEALKVSDLTDEPGTEGRDRIVIITTEK